MKTVVDLLKTWWWVVALVAAGTVVLVLALGKPGSSPKKVVLEEIFTQKPPAQPYAATQAAPAGFTIQVYSLHDKMAAQKAAAELQSAGYKAFIEIGDAGTQGAWYRVRVGGFADEAQARAALEELRKKYKGAFLVPPRT